jgi:hypothetical protein
MTVSNEFIQSFILHSVNPYKVNQPTGQDRMWTDMFTPYFEALPQNSPAGIKENHENLNQNCWSLDQDLKLGPP